MYCLDGLTFWQNRRLTNFPWLPFDEQYKAITAAHKLLMDPYLRSRYHLWKDFNNSDAVRGKRGCFAANAMLCWLPGKSC